MVDPINDMAERVRDISPQQMEGIRRGIEKESLRTAADGALSLTPHPEGLGSSLTHPSITTDFCESQVELVTGPHLSAEACLRELRQIHQFVYRQIDGERLWVGSMPCSLPVDETIPIARFGTSNTGRAKSVYRVGLGHRYGRRMQVISGIHYNWSMPGLTTEAYFSLIRNFRRHSFLLLLLQGASPAVCGSFVAGRSHRLQPMPGGTMGLPYATSLRMGRLGYQSDAQSTLSVSYNCLESYAESLERALTEPVPEYAAIGIHGAAGEYKQLSTALLQIENEFYSTIRPKRVIASGERPLHALRARGVEYVEVRCIDLDPFEPVGISEDMARFLDLFLIHCHLLPSPPDSPDEIAVLLRNQALTSERGREPGLMLERNGRPMEITEWSRELLAAMLPIAAAMDSAAGGSYSEALRVMRDRLDHPAQLPAARLLERIHAGPDGSYIQVIKDQAEWARQSVLGWSWSAESDSAYRNAAAVSIADQRRLESADVLPFEEFRLDYVSPARLRI
jgi:glutamate--cysteine ligase